MDRLDKATLGNGGTGMILGSGPSGRTRANGGGARLLILGPHLAAPAMFRRAERRSLAAGRMRETDLAAVTVGLVLLYCGGI